MMDAEYEREKERELEAKAGDIDAVLDEIKDEWAIVNDLDFNPVDLALQLLDESSLGKDLDSFRRTKYMLSRALKGSVDKHYQAFNAALPHHASLLSHLDVTHTQIKDARTALQEAKETMSSKRADLVQLWSRSQTVEEMMRILDQIEHLRSVPDALESLILEKRLLQAAILLVRSLKFINKQDMLEIGALSDLRSYLNGQETALREILVDELHSHLYLKSFWCESRWIVYTPNQQAFPSTQFEDVGPNAPVAEPQDSSASSPISPTSTRLTRFLDDLAVRPNDPPFNVNDSTFGNNPSSLSESASTSAIGLSTIPSSASLTGIPTNSASMFSSTQSTPSRNPEADSFAYMETLLEALAILGKMGSGLDVVAQKLPAIGPGPGSGRLDDISFLSASTISNNMDLGSSLAGVAISATLSGPVPNGRISRLKATSLRLTALELSTKFVDQETLRDFFWTLYSKLIAVGEGLRVVYEVSNRIGSRRDFKDSLETKSGSLFPIADIWMPVQAEVRTLLTDYITDEEQGAMSGRNPISSINEVLREGRFNRDKTKPVFRFADTDAKIATKILKQHEDELTRVLKDTVPGLVQGSENAVQATLAAVGTDDRLIGVGQHHRLLVHPDAFHVSVLFQPTLAFLDRISDILPSGLAAARASSIVLDDFVLKVYLPQLEDKVSLLFHQAVTGPDAFEPDPASLALSAKPLVKASVQLMALINSLCAMLRTTPFHRENYSRLILTVIGQFYQRCSDRFFDLVSIKDDSTSDDGPRIALAAQWAQKAELSPCLSELLKFIDDDSAVQARSKLCRQETHLESSLGEGSVGKKDLIVSIRNLSALASLYHSVTWFTSELDALKSAPEPSLTTPSKLEPTSASTPYTPYLPVISPLRPNEQLRLPLSSAMALRFQALHMTYDQLAESILYTIRVDIRCRAIHHLGLALRHGIYSY
ncbi:putative exocyst complex component sec8 [Grifola frondosa]|uniref:Exocyst complex component Sec8 n=1 Tax=Grifola frondosa TaxID=5627 RepID=A0A1C7MXU3_GRIFR|nr:putative exocyst complex component sec8 [Grifola frondosa]